MATAPPHFGEQRQKYLDDVEHAISEAGRSFLFLEFSRNVFRQINVDYLEKLFPVLEKHLTTKSSTCFRVIKCFINVMVYHNKSTATVFILNKHPTCEEHP